MVTSTQARQHNWETVRQFLSSQRAENALKSAHMNSGQVQTAVSTLSDQELAQLASRADKAQADFAGGKLEDREYTPHVGAEKNNMLHWIWVIVIGLVIGAVAKLVMPGKDPGGIIVTMLLGIAGSIVATWLGRWSVCIKKGNRRGLSCRWRERGCSSHSTA